MGTACQLVVTGPGAVAWRCAAKLDVAAAAGVALLVEQLQSGGVPGRGGARKTTMAEMGSRMGLDISVADIPDLRHSG